MINSYKDKSMYGTHPKIPINDKSEVKKYIDLLTKGITTNKITK